LRSSGSWSSRTCLPGARWDIWAFRAVAEDHDAPVVENAPLARALHASIEIDEPVPAEHFKAVAQVIGYVCRLQGKIKAN